MVDAAIIIKRVNADIAVLRGIAGNGSADFSCERVQVAARAGRYGEQCKAGALAGHVVELVELVDEDAAAADVAAP